MSLRGPRASIQIFGIAGKKKKKLTASPMRATRPDAKTFNGCKECIAHRDGFSMHCIGHMHVSEVKSNFMGDDDSR